MIGEIRQNFTEACASVGLILATALGGIKYHARNEELYHKLCQYSL